MKMRFAVLAVSVLTLAACANKEFHYWQKTDPSDALYLKGVKAQQMLEQDISVCVHSVIELTKLADVRTGTTAQMYGKDQKQITDEMERLPAWDVPEYIRDLRVDHTDFHDFDGCMNYKGWERVKYVGPQPERRANRVYDATASYSVRPKNPNK
jgi:hypothetical protein